MCGICGFVGPHEPTILHRMRDALRHRGPDDEGAFQEDEVSLGSRRLSIVDRAGGRQPVSNEDGSIVLVFNGEIYNHRELRRRLGPLGHRFTSACDTEVIVHAYEEYGLACLAHLDGMFAFVLYDRGRRLLFGARDRLGKKPLYFMTEPVGSVRFAFASEPKSLREHPAIRARMGLSPEGLVSYLLNDYVVGARSIYTGIGRLEPGCAFVFGLPGSAAPGLHQWRYWDIDLGTRDETAAAEADEERAGAEILALLQEAVERRRMADVPLGIFLSGGIDSSSIVALLARLRPPETIKTFSIGFDEKSFDESEHAASVARHLGTVHRSRQFTAAQCLARLPGVAAMLDEPLADPSILPVSMLCEFAREEVTVALGGDGGDELFAGYDPLRAVRAGEHYHRLVPRALHHAMVLPLVRCLRASDENLSLSFKVSRFLRGAVVDPRDRVATWMGAFSIEQLERLVPDLSPYLVPARAFAPQRAAWAALREAGAGALEQALDHFERFYLPDDILVKLDRASMMHSLELRAPFLDTRLVEYANRLPTRLKLRRGTTKYLLKRAVTSGPSPLLSPAIAYRTKKGFGIPVAHWIRVELAAEFRRTLVEEWPASLAMFDRRQIAHLLDVHVERAHDACKELWALFMLAHWANHYLS